MSSMVFLIILPHFPKLLRSFLKFQNILFPKILESIKDTKIQNIRYATQFPKIKLKIWIQNKVLKI